MIFAVGRRWECPERVTFDKTQDEHNKSAFGDTATEMPFGGRC